MKIKLIVFVCLLVCNFVNAETAVICENCSTESAALSFAKSKTNPLECAPVFGADITCQSRSKIVTFVDANSGQAYKYNVFHENTPPWNVQAEKVALTADREESFRRLMTFIKDTNNSVSEASSDFDQLIGFSALKSPQGNVPSNSAETCPVKTALSTLTNPNTLDFIQERASIEIGMRMISKNNDINLNPVKINNSWTLSFKGLSSTILADSASRNPSFIVTFNESERVSSRKDFFAYSVNILGFDEQNIPIINFTLSDASRVAGYTLGALKGNNGPLDITNECVQEKFEEAVNAGVLTSRSTPVGGSGGGMPGSPPDGGSYYQPSCEIVDFYQSGKRIYTFRICR
jgi:hypothetical protein